MLGFYSLSESPISSLSDILIYIRGESAIVVDFQYSGIGRLDLRGDGSIEIPIVSDTFGILSITRKRKQMIATAIVNRMSSSSSEQSIDAVSQAKNIVNESRQKKIVGTS